MFAQTASFYLFIAGDFYMNNIDKYEKDHKKSLDYLDII